MGEEGELVIVAPEMIPLESVMEYDTSFISRKMRIRKQLYLIFHGQSNYSQLVEWFILIVVTINIISFILSTDRKFSSNTLDLVYQVIETFSIIIFSFEYLLRFWCSAEKKYYRNKREWLGRLRFFFSILSLIDLTSILPWYLMLILHSKKFYNSTIIRILRIFRMFKAEKYSKSFSTIGKVIKEQRKILTATVVLSGVLLVSQATILWIVQKNDNPEEFGSIPRTMWYSVLMLTGMGGYEGVKLNFMGKIVAGFTAILAVALFAIPLGVVSNGFILTREESENHFITCPNCQNRFSCIPRYIGNN